MMFVGTSGVPHMPASQSKAYMNFQQERSLNTSYISEVTEHRLITVCIWWK